MYDHPRHHQHFGSVSWNDGKNKYKKRPGTFQVSWSGRWDLNPGPLAPHASALAGLRHAPILARL